MNRIFVYGTLRKEMYNYKKFLEGKSTFIKYGYIKGSLYTIKGVQYPAFISQGEQMIKGEIYEVDDQMVKTLDELESYNPENLKNSEYIKVQTDIYDENNLKIDTLNIYEYNLQKVGQKELLNRLIKNGDFVHFVCNGGYEE